MLSVETPLVNPRPCTKQVCENSLTHLNAADKNSKIFAVTECRLTAEQYWKERSLTETSAGVRCQSVNAHQQFKQNATRAQSEYKQSFGIAIGYLRHSESVIFVLTCIDCQESYDPISIITLYVMPK